MSNDFEMEDLAKVKPGDGTAVDSHEHDAYEADATFSLWAWNSTVLFVNPFNTFDTDAYSAPQYLQALSASFLLNPVSKTAIISF